MEQSLAVKYRPRTFDEVLGQMEIIGTLKRRIPRANLFVGESGIGKTSLARIIANMVAGGQAGPANVIELDGASHTSVHEINRVVIQAYYRALAASPVKTVIIDECQRLTEAAWTALLKPIEEPPEHVIWCLCTTEFDKVPNTIRTRCVVHNLQPVSNREIIGLLKKVSQTEGINIDGEAIGDIVSDSRGSPRQALTYLESYR